MDAQQQNYESRVETLNALYKRFIGKLNNLPPYEAVVFSTPMCDCLLMAIAQLENELGQRNANDVINDILKNGDNE